jgi:hypothetical protein
LDLPNLELFESMDAMRGVSAQLDTDGYVDNPEFCMVRKQAGASVQHDQRLVFEDAIFVAGSTTPGDDVFVALDLRSDGDDPNLVVFDWRRSVPGRWIAVGRLSEFVRGLAAPE